MVQRILRRAEVEQLTRLHKSTLYRMVNRGEFPAPIKLGRRAIAWHSVEVDAWLATRERAVGPDAGTARRVAVDPKEIGVFAERLRPSDGVNLPVNQAWAAWCEVHSSPADARVAGGLARHAFTRRLRELIPNLPLVQSVRVDGKVQRGWKDWSLVGNDREP